MASDITAALALRERLGHGRIEETRRALDERSKTECDQERLQAPVAGQSGHGVLDHFKIAGLDGHVVYEDGAQYDPADGEQAVAGAIQRGGAGQPRRHAKDQHGHGEGCGQTGQRGPVSPGVAEGEQAQQNGHGEGGDQRGKPYAARNRRIDLSPSHRFPASIVL